MHFHGDGDFPRLPSFHAPGHNEKLDSSEKKFEGKELNGHYRMVNQSEYLSCCKDLIPVDLDIKALCKWIIETIETAILICEVEEALLRLFAGRANERHAEIVGRGLGKIVISLIRAEPSCAVVAYVGLGREIAASFDVRS